MKNGPKLLLVLLMLIHLNLTFSQLKIPVQKTVSDVDLRTLKKSSKSFLSQDNADTLMNTYQYNQTLKNIQNVQYIGNVVVGSQNAVLTVVFDTGSDILWLPSTDCSQCHRSVKFNCDSSTSCKSSTAQDSRLYGSGEIVGYLAQDMIGLSNDSKVSYNFLLVEADSGLDSYHGDGIMGMSNDQSQFNFVDLAYTAGLIDDKVFSFYMDYDMDYNTPSYKSYMSVGYIPEKHINNVTWLPVTDDSYWSTDVLAMKVNDQNIEFGSDPDISNVLFDTGTSYMLVADPVFTTFQSELVNQGCGYQYSTLLCPCSYMSDYDKLPNITFYTRGAEFVVTAFHYLINPGSNIFTGLSYCQVAVESTYSPQGGADRQILGDSFLRANFVGFSKRNQSMALNAENMTILTPVDHLYNYWTGIFCSVVMLLAILVVAFLTYRNNNKSEQTQVRDSRDLGRADNYYSIG